MANNRKALIITDTGYIFKEFFDRNSSKRWIVNDNKTKNSKKDKLFKKIERGIQT